MEAIFYICVEILLLLATIFKCTYEEINVVIFCIVGPIVFLSLLIWNIKLRKTIKNLKTITDE